MGNKDQTKEWPRTMVLVKVKDFLFRARHPSCLDRDQLLTPMLLNQCYTFLLECSHSCKNYTSIITDRFLATKYPLRHESGSQLYW
jgi:hypothetical protein